MTNTLVITVEALPAYLLGPYGADNARTATFDVLAAEGILLDRLYADSLSPRSCLISLWTGQHAVAHTSQRDTAIASTIWHQAGRFGVNAIFTTDCADVADLAQQAGCENVSLVQTPQPEVACTDPMQSNVLAPWLTLAEGLARGDTKGLHWLHSLGLRGPWDAPRELRAQFADPEDPSPPDGVAPPDFDCSGIDPDEIVGYGQVASAQVAVLDEGLALLMSAIASRPDADSWNIVVVSLGGYPLGEHGYVGMRGLGLHESHLACVGLIRPALQKFISRRLAHLCQLPDVGATIAQLALAKPVQTDALGESSNTAPTAAWGSDVVALEQDLMLVDTPQRHSLAYAIDCPTDSLSSSAAEAAWLRSPAWTLRTIGDQSKLHAMPDDRWEVCDVASRCPDTVDALRHLMDAFRRAALENGRDLLPEIDVDLTSTMR